MGFLGAKSPAATFTSNSTNDTMTPSSTLDLFMLTFNCAKNLINVPVFSSHLHAALVQNSTGLPDLVVLSLQEVAPLSYAFIGSYFLNPYYARFGDALNLASAKVLATTPTASGSSSGGPHPYTLIRAKNVGMTSILLYARDPAAVGAVEEAECGFGAADMGNKGAVGLRVTWITTPASASTTEFSKSTELTFVAAHLAAMEWNLKKRNANWRSIVAGLTFSNPRDVLPGVFPPSRESSPTPDRSGAGDRPPSPALLQPDLSASSASIDSSEAEEEATHPLLSSSSSSPLEDNIRPLSSAQAAALQATSIFKPTSHLFVAGDLNYRISSSTPPPLAPFPSFDPSSENYFPKFLPRDQLTQERHAGRAFAGMEEAPIAFGPTYKFDILSQATGAVNERAVKAKATVNGVPEVPWKFAPHRWPGWCDRVLFLEPPSVSEKRRPKMDVKSYDAFPVLESSDHRPVFLRVKVPVLDAAEMTAATARKTETQDGQEEEEEDGKIVDPRTRMLVAVDVDAWERRAAARKKEVVVGWTAFLWSTREGAMVLGTLLMLAVGSWWLMRVW